MKRAKQKKEKGKQPISFPEKIFPFGNKIPPKKCLIINQTTPLKEYLPRFRVKRLYHNSIKFDESVFWSHKNKDICSFAKTFKRAKYFHKLTINNSNMFRYLKLSMLSQFISRLKTLNIQADSISIFTGYFGQRADLKQIKHFFRNLQLNLTDFHLNIPFGYGYDESMITEFTKCLIRVLRTMCNLKSFAFKSKQTYLWFKIPFPESTSIYDQRSITLNQQQFQRLKKLERLQLACSMKLFLAMRFFDNNFAHLSQLRNLEILSLNASHGKHLFEKIKEVQSLQSLTISYCMEPDDLLNLCINLPNLRRLAIKDDWIFSSKALSYIDPNKIHVKHLEFDFPLDIEAPEDSTFMVSFLEMFKLQSLKLYIRCFEEEKVPPFDIIEAILHQELLESLTFGILATPISINKTFDNLASLNRLTKLSLLLRPGRGISWTQEHETTFQALEKLIFQNKLTDLEIYWERITSHCMERMRKFFKNAPKLDYFKLAFTTPYERHGVNHQNVLSHLEYGLADVKSVSYLDIFTSCFNCNFQRSTKSKKGILMTAEENKSIKKLNIIPANMKETQFTGEKLSH